MIRPLKMMNKFTTAIVSFAALAAASSAFAATVPYGGLLTATPTFARPVSLTGLSGVGTAVGYATIPFTVDVSGGYTITQTTATYDGFLLLYSGTFTPSTPLVNLINGDDDFDPDGLGPLGTGAGSQILATGGTAVSNFANTNNLTAGTQYILVSTSFSNGASGAFVGTIDGPGTALIPEPTSLALLSLGGLAALRRRRA